MEWGGFISHASEDKNAFVRPLAEGLRKAGLKVWFDEFTLTVGDSLRRSIDHGLARSRFGIVVISESFLTKEWPQKELDGLVAREVGGVKVILPVWHGVTADDVRAYSPILADRLAVSSDRGLDHVVAELMRAIQRDDQSRKEPPSEPSGNRDQHARGGARSGARGGLNPTPARSAPSIPKIRRTPSDLEKRRFIQAAFETIAAYFKQGSELAGQQEGIDADFQQESTTRFTAELFVDGKSRRRCKIWINNNEIDFSENPLSWGHNDNSCNEILALVQDELALRALMGMAWANEGEGLDLNYLTPEDAAEFLWRRFAARLN